jgi:uncharacterized protein (TIGR03000 family)
MYSVVLMMALTGSAETPDFGHHSRCGCSCGCSCGYCGGCSCGCSRCHHGHSRCHRCSGCCSNYCCSGFCGGYCGGFCNGGGCCGGGVVVPNAPGKEMPKKTEVDAPATIVVSLPAEARLIIDGNSTTSTSARRVFTSPALQPGQTYVYTLRAEIVRDGQTMSETQQVTVRAGEQTPVTFNMSQAVASR